MSAPDPEAIEITGDPGTVWRVGFEPDPWAWTPWIYATDAGLFDGRWDDQHGVFRTLYTSASLLGCFLELLAKHRPDSVVVDALDQIDDPGNLAAHEDEAPPGAIGYDWLEGRQFGRALQFGRYCFISHSRTVAALDAAGLFAARGIASRDVDAALLKKADDRTELVDGIEFRSRLGDEIRMWAVFERSPDQTRRHSSLIRPEWAAPGAPDTPELVDAFSQLGLFWHEPANGGAGNNRTVSTGPRLVFWDTTEPVVVPSSGIIAGGSSGNHRCRRRHPSPAARGVPGNRVPRSVD